MRVDRAQRPEISSEGVASPNDGLRRTSGSGRGRATAGRARLAGQLRLEEDSLEVLKVSRSVLQSEAGW